MAILLSSSCHPVISMLAACHPHGHPLVIIVSSQLIIVSSSCHPINILLAADQYCSVLPSSAQTSEVAGAVWVPTHQR
eukprot:3898297-Amphidinium_carterae.1